MDALRKSSKYGSKKSLKCNLIQYKLLPKGAKY